MRALRWHARGDVRVEDVPAPGLAGDSDVIVEVEACGLCGTDVEEVRYGPKVVPVEHPHPLTGVRAPLTLGHEILGRVVAAGPGSPVRPGDRVVPNPCLADGTCAQCRAGAEQRCEQFGVTGMTADGGMAEQVRLDGRACVRIGDEVPLALAVLTEPYSIAFHVVAGTPLEGRRVVVVGLGTIGRAVLDVARLRGAAEVIGVDPAEAARRAALDAGAVEALEPVGAAGLDADVVVEASGADDGLRHAIEACRKGADVLAVGIPGRDVVVPVPDLVLREVVVRGRVGQRLPEVAEAADALTRGLVGSAAPTPVFVGLEAAAALLTGTRQAPRGAKVAVLPTH